MKVLLMAGLLAMALCCVASSGMCTGKEDTAFNSIKITVRNNIRLVRSFLQYFDNATNERWDTLGNNFLVKFNINHKQARALFGNNGRLIYSILFGTEKDLPTDVRHQVRSAYNDYHITRSIEVQENRRTIWIVEMADNDKHLTVRIEDNEMEVVQRYIDN